MMGKTHKVGGLLSSAAFLSLFPQSPLLTLGVVGCGIAGSLLPDLDHHNSTASKSLGLMGGLTSAVFHHRGILHSPLLYTVLYLFLHFCFPGPYSVLVTAVYLGILSHLLLDFLNPRGIPLFSPLSKKKFHLLSVQTGGFGEKIVRLLLWIGCVPCCTGAVLHLIKFRT